MTANLPSLEEPPAGTTCPKCGAEVRLVNFCPECFEAFLRDQEDMVQRDHEEARRRARVWRTLHGRNA